MTPVSLILGTLGLTARLLLVVLTVVAKTFLLSCGSKAYAFARLARKREL